MNHPITSFSRLGVYTECPKKYENKYVLKVPAQAVIEDYFLKGRLTHVLMESILQELTIDETFTDFLPTWLEKDCDLPFTLDSTEPEEGVDVRLLVDYSDKMANLLLRAAPNYIGEDAIRNNDGSPLKNPIAFPSKSFKAAFNSMGLDRDKFRIDQTAARLNKEYERFSLANTAASALFCARNFTFPDWYGETIVIEHRFEDSNNPVFWDNGRLIWAGGPDWICKTKTGEVVIVDHKTSASAPSKDDVLWHPQLALYVHLYYEQTGILADAVAINHLPSNSLIIAAVDPVIVKNVLEQAGEIQKAINASVFPRSLPTTYNSPCIKKDFNKNVKGYCPYLEHCWPEYYQDVVGIYNAPTI